jgi:hypothetical protein
MRAKSLTAIEQIVMALNEHETVFMSNNQLAQLHGYFKPSDALVISMQSDGWLVRLAGAPQR